MAVQNNEQSNVCQCVSLGDSCSLILCMLVVAITFGSCLWNLVPLLCGFQTAAIHAPKKQQLQDLSCTSIPTYLIAKDLLMLKQIVNCTYISASSRKQELRHAFR